MPQTHFTPNASNALLSNDRLSLLVAEDVGVTSVENGHGGASEKLAGSGTKLNLSRGKQVSI